MFKHTVLVCLCLVAFSSCHRGTDPLCQTPCVMFIVNHDDLIRHHRNAAHDEQHRTGILRDFETFVFHGN